MKNEKTISLTEARKKIFILADAVQSSGSYYTLTDRGVPKAVLLGEKNFQSLLQKQNRGFSVASDGNAHNNYQPVHVKTLIVRDESRVIYLPEQDPRHSLKEEALIRAQLYVELIEKYHYPYHLIEVGRYVKVGHSQSRNYIEADILVDDSMGNVDMVLMVRSFDKFEEEQDRTVADLFSLAYASTYVKKPRYLVYFSRRFRNGEAKTKVSVIDYTEFNTFASWKKAGRPSTDQIPEYSSRR